MKKSEVQIGDKVITDVYNNLGDLIIAQGTIVEIYNDYCIVKNEKGYCSCINFDGEGEHAN